MDIRSLLVDIDPGRDRQVALDRATQIAAPLGATIHLLVTDYRQWLSGGVLFDDRSLKRSRDEYIDSLARWVESLAGPLQDRGFSVETHVNWNSSRSESVIETAKELGPDMIVRAATEHTGLNRLLLNATDWELIRRAPGLLWLVKKPTLPASRMNILAAIDPTHPKDQEMGLDGRIVEAADEIRKIFSANLQIFHAYVPPSTTPALGPGAGIGAPAVPIPPVDEETLEDIRRMHWDKLRQLADTVGVDDDEIHMIAGSTVHSIQEVVAEEDISLVVTGAIARSWLKRLIIGSTAEAFLEALDCDILVVKPEHRGGRD